MKTKFFLWLSVVLLFSMLATPVAAGSVPPNAIPNRSVEAKSPPGPQQKLQLTDAGNEVQPFNGRYFVLLDGESLVQSFSADSRQIQVDAPDAQVYLNLLRREQDSRLQHISRVVQRSLQPIFRYDVVLNGFALQLSPDEAARIRGLPGVRAVIPDRLEQPLTDAGPWFIGADKIWDGDTPSDVSTKGEGIVVGILDTGINFDHPSFADDADPTYNYPDTPPKGVCAVSGGPYENACNNKLIGAYSFTTETVTPEDTNGHGSHTASTVAGNPLTIASFNGVPSVQISGVAPRAQIIAYDVCDDSGCATTASVAAVQQAILDGVDVINYSISGGKSPYSDPVELAFLEAFDAGIFVAASAGNQRTEPTTDGQVNHVSPWVMTVAASSHNRRFGHYVDVVYPDYYSELQSIMAIPGNSPEVFGFEFVQIEIRYDPNNTTGCIAYNDEYFMDAIALVQDGDCTFFEKINHARNAGAIGVLVYNHNGMAYYMDGLENTDIPSAMMDRIDGENLSSYILDPIKTDNVVKVNISPFGQAFYTDRYVDIQADFSFRGPSSNDFEVLKPDITAPGLEVLAAVGDGEITAGSEAEFDLYQGTSMSSPHVAGAAALLKALHPDWSPAAIKSALMMTAKTTGLLKEDRTTPADPFDHGGGRVDLSAAARTALVLDETTTHFEAADPANGGDPKSLNLPGLQNNFCVASCSWTRTFTNVSNVAVSMAITTPAWITATPASLNVGVGESQSVTFTADVSTLPLNEWTFETVSLNTHSTFSEGTEIADLHLPVAVRPMEKPADIEPPRLESLLPLGVARTNQQTVSFVATFTEKVKGVDVGDFATVEGGGVSGSRVAEVSGAGQSFTITVDTGSGDGSLGLKLAPAAEISDLADNPLTEIPSLDPTNVYWLDKTVPTVQSFILLDLSPTPATEIRFQVAFSEPVSGLKVEDFEVIESEGLSGSSVKAIEPRNPGSYIVTLITGGQEGRLGLRLKAGTSASDEAGNTIGGLPYSDPDKSYWIDKVAPQVIGLRRLDQNPTRASEVGFEVMFSEAVENVDPADFWVVERDGLRGSSILDLSGDTNVYRVRLNTGSGSGKLGLRLSENVTIQDMAGNPLGNLSFYDPDTEYTIEEWIFLYLPVIRK